VKRAAISRMVTTLAVGFLILDALLFAMAERFVPAGFCAAAAIVVLIAWRRYRRAMAELADVSREMKQEVESLRSLFETHLRN
jgi:uncharacterized protein YjiS (DUF1127 family)